MAALSTRKSRLRVEFSETYRERGRQREVIMELTPWSLRVRLKGMRQTFDISPVAVYQTAARIEAERIRAEKRKARQSKFVPMR